jgi:nicotinamide-nucleotide amidase
MAGYLLVHDDKPIFFLPGIPSQMKHLLVEQVLPKLSTWQKNHKLTTYQRIFRIFNIPETEVNRRINTLDLSPDVHIGYYPVFPEVHLSLTVRDKENNNAERLFKSSCHAITTVLGDAVYGYDRDNMEMVTGKLLTERGLSLAVAESCTGGLIAGRITNTPGSSLYFFGGVVAYADHIKRDILGIPAEILTAHGAVSRETAEAMARGMRKLSGADIALAVTGIAGPGGGSAEKPVGTVYIAIASGEEQWGTKFLFRGDRQQVRELTAQSGLDLVRKYLLQRTTDK